MITYTDKELSDLRDEISTMITERRQKTAHYKGTIAAPYEDGWHDGAVRVMLYIDGLRMSKPEEATQS